MQAQRRGRRDGQFVKRASFTRSVKETEPAIPGHGKGRPLRTLEDCRQSRRRPNPGHARLPPAQILSTRPTSGRHGTCCIQGAAVATEPEPTTHRRLSLAVIRHVTSSQRGPRSMHDRMSGCAFRTYPAVTRSVTAQLDRVAPAFPPLGLENDGRSMRWPRSRALRAEVARTMRPGAQDASSARELPTALDKEPNGHERTTAAELPASQGL